jgi:hypothetical protein
LIEIGGGIPSWSFPDRGGRFFSKTFLAWRSAVVDDAEWVSGKSRDRLAFDLDRGFLMDVRPEHATNIVLGALV